MKEEKTMNAMDIVDSVKSYDNFIRKEFYRERVNFLGCSESYVEEKINILIYNLQGLKKFLRETEKSQSRIAKELSVLRNKPL